MIISKTKNLLRTMTLFRPFSSGTNHQQFDPTAIILRNQRTGYYMDPNQVARRLMRMIAQHPNVKNIEKMTLNTQWWQLGINDLDYVELTVAIETAFYVQFPDDVAEKFKDINDMMEYIARSYWAK